MYVSQDSLQAQRWPLLHRLSTVEASRQPVLSGLEATAQVLLSVQWPLPSLFVRLAKRAYAKATAGISEALRYDGFRQGKPSFGKWAKIIERHLVEFGMDGVFHLRGTS